MMTKRISVYLFAMAALLAVGIAPEAQAQESQEAIKERMIERVDEIDAMKTKGLVGENYQGFLEQRGPLDPNQTALMNAENADRKALYTILAERLGLTVKVVGQGRAADLREKSALGVWLQNSDGEWYKK